MRLRVLAAIGLVGVLASCTTGADSSASPSSSATPPTPAVPPTHVPPAPQPSGSDGAADWLTYHRDPARSGVDPSSPPLGRPRLAWTSAQLDGDVYAQPLVFGDRVFVATEHDSVYALDAGTGTVIWRTNLGDPVPQAFLPCGNIDPTGITGTPAIDPASGLLYAVAFVQ
ncbi:MAG TPA: PQQ-binding-like beta-propeller repeat protein, partial [Actinomycetota bacterium]